MGDAGHGVTSTIKISEDKGAIKRARALPRYSGANAPINEINSLVCLPVPGDVEDRELPSCRIRDGTAFPSVNGGADVLADGSVPAVGGDRLRDVLPDALAGDGWLCGVPGMRLLGRLRFIAAAASSNARAVIGSSR